MPDFNVRPRHVGMFGAQGILKPLYERQATKMALSEQQRQEQSRFEQMKALTEMRANLQRQIGEPLQKERIAEAEAGRELDVFKLGEAKELDRLISGYGAARTEEERADYARQIIVRQGGLRQAGEEQPQKFRIWYNPETGRYEETAASGIDYPTKTALGGGGEDQRQLTSSIPMTAKDIAFEEDQARQLVGGLGGEKLRPDVLKKLGIKQAGTVDNYINKFTGGEWSQGKMDEFAKILAYMSNPANERVIRSDKQIQTIWSAMRRLQRVYDPVYRDAFLRPQGGVPGQIQGAGGEDKFGIIEATGGAGAGGGYPAPTDTMMGQQPQLSPEEVQMMRTLEEFQRNLPAYEKRPFSLPLK